MPSLARILGLSALLLLLFLVVLLVAQRWLQSQHGRLREEAITERRGQFHAAVEATGGAAAAWDDARFALIGRLINARVYPRGSRPLPAVDANRHVVLIEPLPHATPPAEVVVAFQLPATTRMSLAHGRTWALLLVLVLTLMLLFILAALYSGWRESPESKGNWSAARAEMNSLESLARTSAAQGSALAEERDNRQRVEQDLLLNQRRLNQALEEKIRLGRDLHDGVIQSLYAVGLTIESVRALLPRDPQRADQRLQQCLDGLNRTIRDVRDYITGLAPEKLRRMSFAAAVEMMLQELRGSRQIGLELIVDDEAAAALTAAQTNEALQVAREAISNALRHGQADGLTLRLHRGDAEVGLLVQDNGRGFRPETAAGRGHGLGNMQARAAAAGATLRIDSLPGAGTRVVMTFPVSPVI